MNFNIITLGCKVNQYESQVMHESLVSKGYVPAEEKEHADISVINTCTVTAVSDSKNRKLIRRLRRNNPHGIIVLTGCMPQAFPDDIEMFGDCDIVLGNAARSDLTDCLEQFYTNHQQIVQIKKHKEKNDTFEKMSVNTFSDRTRAFVKIQDGCNRFCSYCIIPYARGRVRSKKLEELKAEIQSLSENGYQEIVLVGINLSAYGQDIGLHLCDAVDCVCSVPGIRRVRLGSIEPELITRQSVERLAKNSQFCPQFHLSLQSGCDATLRRMNRHYNTLQYTKIVNDLKGVFPNVSITTDVMVGFPGETREEFEQSLRFVQDIGFAKVHVFPYSRRRGTAADTAPDQVSQQMKEQRSKIMIEKTDLLREQFLQLQVGFTEEVLFEKQNRSGFWEGYTKNYTPVQLKTEQDLSGKLCTVTITGTTGGYCFGELI